MNRTERRLRKKEAKKAAKPASTAAPLQALIDLAVEHHSAGRLADAERLYQQVLQTDANNAVVLHLLGALALQGGNALHAVELISKCLSAQPQFVEAHSSLGNAFKALDRFEDAVASYQTALSLNPNYAKGHYNLGTVFQHFGQTDQAVACFQKALSLDPNFFEAHNNLGAAQHGLGNLEQAAIRYQKALTLDPESAETHNALGIVRQQRGQLDQAQRSFKAALTINPDYAEAHLNLATLKTHSHHDPDILAMERAFARTGLSDSQKMHFAFGLGKAFEDLQQYDKAFAFFSQANTLKRNGYPYSTDDSAGFLKSITNVFDQTFFGQHLGAGYTGQTPIFIVGMPRSGTTLVEQIISSHPDVFGGGELKTLAETVCRSFPGEFPHSLGEAKTSDFTKVGAAYVKAVKGLNTKVSFITDKMPENYLNIGLIKLALPQAKIIHCKRNAADNGLSLFKTCFSEGGHLYANELSEIGRYYQLYSNLMAHWKKLLPGFVYDIQYENIVNDQVGQTQALLDHLGLEWNDACLNFHTANRPVKTASAAQVRQPLYSRSVDAWRHYEKHMTPLLKILNSL